jgi:hypothetical protein
MVTLAAQSAAIFDAISTNSSYEQYGAGVALKACAVCCAASSSAGLDEKSLMGSRHSDPCTSNLKALDECSAVPTTADMHRSCTAESAGDKLARW